MSLGTLPGDLSNSPKLQLTDRIVEICDEFGNKDKIRVSECNTGLGIFAVRPYPATAVVGEITGEVHDSPYGNSYSFDLENGQQLEPAEPFRYVNHCCDPNCEFDWIEEQTSTETKFRIYLVALRDIQTDEQFTIDYNWPATYAIRCDCRSPLCRGWVVGEEELGKLHQQKNSRIASSPGPNTPPASPAP